LNSHQGIGLLDSKEVQMRLREFLANPDWDAPFFKRLAHNDTGSATGHQAGIVFPKDLRQFLPSLDETATSPVAPTIDRYLRAEMFVGIAHLTDCMVRYQFQTWGGTRSAESRITDGLRTLRDLAHEDDLILFQRRADALDWFRLILVSQGTPEFNEIRQWLDGRRWGKLFDEAPVTQTQLERAEAEILNLGEQPFQVVRAGVQRIETRQSRIARSSVFREQVRREYRYKCAVSGIFITTPTMLPEVESSHIVPVSEGGSDDIRNGFTLTQTLHWAFDRGLFGILPNRTIYIPQQVKRMTENAFLKQFENKPITEATSSGSGTDERHFLQSEAF
jgi:putative restriction endonuclease